MTTKPMTASRPAYVRGLESLLALLSPDEREQLSALLARLLHSMAALRT
ncbi:hypothetical protein [Microbispora sp. GKU 823]|nr:hypothetical protein [Microbispora sp. GKU 823]